MYWYLPRENPHDVLLKLAQLRENNFKGMSKQEIKEVSQKVVDLEAASAKNFYICRPESKLYKWFLMPFEVKAITGGNRSGKTTALVIDNIMQAEGWHPLQRKNLEILAKEAEFEWVRELCKKILKGRRWIASPPVKLRYMAVDYDNYIDKIIGPDFRRWATHSEIKSFDYLHEKKRSIFWKNGSNVEFTTYNQSFESQSGTEKHKVSFDEEPPSKEFYVQSGVSRVLSLDGTLLLGMTAEKGVTWTKDEIFNDGFEGKNSKFAITLSTYENPVIPKRVTAKKANLMSKDDQRIRIDGEIIPRGGNVYKMYRDEHPWLVEPFRIPKDSGELICAIDPHPRTPHAVVWCWVDFDGRYHPLFEGLPNIYAVDAMTLEGHATYVASMIRQKEAFIGRLHDVCLCDPSAFDKDQRKTDNRSMAEQFVDAGLYVERGSKDLAGNIMKFGEMLSLTWIAEDDELKQRKNPQFMIFDTDEDSNTGLGRFRWELQNYRWPSPSMSARIDQPIKQKPVDKDDHLIEDAHRICAYVESGEFEITDRLGVFAGTNTQMTILNSRGEKVQVELEQPEEQELDWMT